MGTHFKGSAAQAQALDTYVKLVRAAESFMARAHETLPAGLTISQFGVLEALLHLGPLCQKDLARKLLKSPGNLTLVIDNLERDGLVARERDTKDRRYITVALTAKGRRFIDALFPKTATRITAEMSALTSAEQVTLAQLCKTLGLSVRGAS